MDRGCSGPRRPARRELETGRDSFTFAPSTTGADTSILEIGLRFGWGLNETTPAFFSNVGVGMRY